MPITTKKELLDYLEEEARQQRNEILASIKRNRHMNDLSEADFTKLDRISHRLMQKFIDALLVSFINRLAVGQGIDLGLYTKYITGDKKALDEQESCGCKKCDENSERGESPVQFKDKETTCFVCKQKVKQVLDLHHTNADLCSLECEKKY